MDLEAGDMGAMSGANWEMVSSLKKKRVYQKSSLRT